MNPQVLPMNPQVLPFGVLLRMRREEAHLSRATVAKQSKLSEATIKLIESHRTRLIRTTLLALQSVPALRLQEEDMPPEFQDSRRTYLLHEEPLRKELDKQYLSAELMVRESVLSEVFEYVCAQLIQLKQRKDELNQDKPPDESVPAPDVRLIDRGHPLARSGPMTSSTNIDSAASTLPVATAPCVAALPTHSPETESSQPIRTDGLSQDPHTTCRLNVLNPTFNQAITPRTDPA